MSLYKVAILDDEILIADGIGSKINWDQLGCEVDSIAYDGQHGMQIVKNNNIDILITDVVMPVFSGLEIAEYIHKNKLDIKVVLLSAFDDFSYAQQAISYGVKDYILKPFDKNILIETIKKIVKNLNDNNKKLIEQENIKKIKPLLSQAFLFDNTVNNLNKEEIEENYSNIYDSVYSKGVITVIEVDNIEDKLKDLVLFSVYNLTKTHLESSEVDFIIKQNLDKIITIFPNSEHIDMSVLRNRIISLNKHLLNEIYEKLNITCYSAISVPYNSINNMNDSYIMAINLLKQSYFEKNPRVFYDEISNKIINSFNVIQNMDIEINNMTSVISMGNTEKAVDIFHKIADSLLEVKNIDYAVSAFYKIAIGLSVILINYDELTEEEIEPSTFNTGSFFKHRDMIEEKIYDICIYIKSKQRVIGRILLIIEKSYNNPDFGLQQVSDELNLNQSYISRLFKKEMEVNFSQYLIEYRIKKACELLQLTEYKSNEISRMVGFADERYFSTVFKKKCGCTPKVYRNKKI